MILGEDGLHLDHSSAVPCFAPSWFRVRCATATAPFFTGQDRLLLVVGADGACLLLVGAVETLLHAANVPLPSLGPFGQSLLRCPHRSHKTQIPPNPASTVRRRS